VTRVVVFFALFSCCCSRQNPLHVDRTSLPADGVSTFQLNAPVTVREGARYVRLEPGNRARSTILPGRFVLEGDTGTLALNTRPVEADSAHDGTPDYLRLDSPADQSAFRDWFTFLAEVQFFRTPLPREINDCAALIRYSYREALSIHNDAWIAAAHLPEIPPFRPIDKYAYPATLLGANLFRIRPGEYSAADIGNGSFAQFADAKTLLRFNTHLVGRNLDQAEPGDILWFHQLSQQMPFHTMIFLGPSKIDHTPGPYVVYHTGPNGVMRRIATPELLTHPDPQWRPFPSNSNFLGVYRWNIL
jgi:uncharacterized protein